MHPAHRAALVVCEGNNFNILNNFPICLDTLHLFSHSLYISFSEQDFERDRKTPRKPSPSKDSKDKPRNASSTDESESDVEV